MQIRIKRFTFSVAAALLILGLSVSLLSIQKREEPSDIPMLTLVKPALAQTSGSSTTFLDEEAGIALYTDVKQTIDLAKAKNVYRTVEKETLDYVVGSVALPNLQTSDDAHCFIHRNGWIVIYYLKGEPASKILDWRYYSGGKLSKNKLQLGLEKVCNTLGITASEVGYYHFQYPQANRLLIIIGSQTGSGEHVFYYQIPSSLDVFDGSWTHYALSGNEERVMYGTIQKPMLNYETRHTVKVMNVRGGYWDYYAHFMVDGEQLSSFASGSSFSYSCAAVFLIYREL